MEENIKERITKETEQKITEVLDQGLHEGNVDLLYTLVDIHKDIANENYWEEKEDAMRYRNYSEGSYREHDMYGRRQRDSRGRYKGHEMMDDMYRGYEEYSEGKERYKRGSYGAKEDTMKSLEYMLESMVDFVEMLCQDANSQEEVDLIKHYTRKIAEM